MHSEHHLLVYFYSGFKSQAVQPVGFTGRWHWIWKVSQGENCFQNHSRAAFRVQDVTLMLEDDYSRKRFNPHCRSSPGAQIQAANSHRNWSLLPTVCHRQNYAFQIQKPEGRRQCRAWLQALVLYSYNSLAVPSAALRTPRAVGCLLIWVAKQGRVLNSACSWSTDNKIDV